MRAAGWAVSAVGHVGFIMMTLLAWETRSTFMPSGGSVVPVDIVDVAPESNVRAMALNPGDEADIPPPPANEDTPQPAAAASAPTPTPTPAQRRRTAEQEQRDLLAQTMTNLGQQPQQRHHPGPQGNSDRDASGPGDMNVVSLQDRARALARAHLVPCWRMPIDLPDPERLVVTVQFDLNRNGTLNGQPVVTNPRNYTFDPVMRTAADAALRAVRTCDFSFFSDDPVVGNHYEIWRHTEFTFRPTS